MIALLLSPLDAQITGSEYAVDRGAPRSRFARVTAPDADLGSISRAELIDEVVRLRQGIRQHRDSAGHDLCWHHPQLWGLLPESTDPLPAVPDWPTFLRGCLHYRQSLYDQLPAAARVGGEYHD